MQQTVRWFNLKQMISKILELFNFFKKLLKKIYLTQLLLVLSAIFEIYQYFQ